MRLAAGRSRADLRDLLELQQDIATHFSTPALSIDTQNGSVLTVTFQNAAVADAPEEQREEFARRVAEYVRDYYPGYGNLSRVVVTFSNVSSTGPVTVTRGVGGDSYSTFDLGEPSPPDTSAAEKAAA